MEEENTPVYSRNRGGGGPPSVVHPLYGKLYLPLYDLVRPMPSEQDYSKIYNEDGREKERFFYRDVYCRPGKSKYIEWDLYNFGLSTHFYSHTGLCECVGNPTRKYAVLVESEVIVPQDYKLFFENPAFCEDFDAVFTFSQQLLEMLPNALFYPYMCDPYFGGKHGGEIASDNYLRKTKNISAIASNKTMCRMHLVRAETARICKRDHLADVFGQFDGGRYVEKYGEEVLQDYRYFLAIENDITDYYFTEKILSCFAAQVVPIYLGAGKIGDFFNMDGIIQIEEKDLSNLPRILSQCSEQDYLSRIPAILDNYNRYMSYPRMWDWIYESYFLNPPKVLPGPHSTIENRIL